MIYVEYLGTSLHPVSTQCILVTTNIINILNKMSIFPS